MKHKICPHDIKAKSKGNKFQFGFNKSQQCFLPTHYRTELFHYEQREKEGKKITLNNTYNTSPSCCIPVVPEQGTIKKHYVL